MCRYPAREIVERLPGDAHPPLYYLVCKVWATFLGDSLVSLRGLAVVFGLAGAAVLCRLTWQTINTIRGVHPSSNPKAGTTATGATLDCSSCHGASLFVCALAALSAGQVFAASNARMYALGLLLAMLSAWALWQACQSSSALTFWWPAYALATAAFCYTHYFAFFAVAAQAIFVAGFCVFRRAVHVAAGWLYACLLVGISYAHWVPIFLAQAGDVEAGWWVPAPTPEVTERLCLQWLSGTEGPELWPARAWLSLLGAIIAWTLWRGGAPAWFFFLQAFVPWVCVIAVYSLGTVSLLQLHYFAFAQAALLGLWGVAWAVLPGWPQRGLLIVVLGLPLVWGLVEYRRQLPDGPPALAHAAAFVKETYQEGDWFLVEDHRKLNLFRYYTTEAGLPWLTVKCRLSLFQKGHVVHVASMDASEFCWSEDDLWRAGPGRVWLVSFSATGPHRAPPGRRLALQRVFDGAGETKCTLALYERE